MTDPFNPYAPPVAEVEQAQQVGMVAREGKLVRMDRNGQLPDRCVTCNARAGAERVSRTLYWTRWEWRLALWGIPLFLFAMTTTGNEFAMGLFFPALLVLVIANVIVRKRLPIEVGLCARHLRIRRVLGALIWTCCLVGIALPFASIWIGSQRIGVIVLVLAGSMLVLGFAYSFSAANRIGIKRLDERHVWLKGIGTPFRESLPQATPD